MVQGRIVLGHLVSSQRIKVDQLKIDVLKNLPPQTNVRGVDLLATPSSIDVSLKGLQL